MPGNPEATSPDQPPGPTVSRWLLPIGLFLLAGAVRTIVWPTVFVGGHVMVVGNDTYYHLRRILYACADWPRAVGFDPFLNFPDGARAIWPPFLDVAIAAVVRLGSAGTAEDVERIAIWVPPVIGAAVVAGVFLLVRRHFGSAGGVLGALALCFTPAHVWYSQLSFVDHHVAVAGVAIALFAVVLALSDSLGGPDAPRRERRLALGAGLLLSLGVHVWTGFLLHQVILLAPALLALLVIEERERARRLTTALAWIHGVPLVLVAPFGLGQEWSQSEVASFTPIALSNFHPWFFGVLTVFFVACTASFGRAPGDTRLRRSGTALVVGVLCLASIVPLLAGIAGGIADSLDFFLKSQPSMGQVAESLTILRFGGQAEPSLAPALRFASGLFLLGPLCGLAVWLAARGDEARVRAGWILWWTVAWTGCALVQSRLANSLSVANAIAFGAAAQLALGGLAGRGLG
ncbi:MAG: hypothetical protein HKP30_09215, partial [Myxococcales bacterium]|nr:hypothetical protein [Myxococcales bacterium]